MARRLTAPTSPPTAPHSAAAASSPKPGHASTLRASAWPCQQRFCIQPHRLPTAWNYLALELARTSSQGDPDLCTTIMSFFIFVFMLVVDYSMLLRTTDGLFDFGAAHHNSSRTGPSGDLTGYDFSDTSSGLRPTVSIRVPHSIATHVSQPPPVGMQKPPPL